MASSLDKAARIQLGNVFKPYGVLVAKGCLSGEEYYWFANQIADSIAMMPASVIDPLWEMQCQG